MVTKMTFSCLQLSQTATTFFWVLNWSQHALLQNIAIRPCGRTRPSEWVTPKELDGAHAMSQAVSPGGRAAAAWRWTAWRTDGRWAWTCPRSCRPWRGDQHWTLDGLQWARGAEWRLGRPSLVGQQAALIWWTDSWESRFRWSVQTLNCCQTSRRRQQSYFRDHFHLLTVILKQLLINSTKRQCFRTSWISTPKEHRVEGPIFLHYRTLKKLLNKNLSFVTFIWSHLLRPPCLEPAALTTVPLNPVLNNSNLLNKSIILIPILTEKHSIISY